MNETSKRKDWVKNAAIIFLSVLLVLTFFSNTIMNYSLPEVAAQYCMSGSITNKVRGTGVVESADPYSVTYKETRKIASVKVKPGDEVKKGDVLYLLEEGESGELKEAESALKTAKSEYEKAAIEGGFSSSDTANFEKRDPNSDSTEYQDKGARLKKAKESTDEALEKVQKEIEDFEYYTYNKWNDGSSEERANLDRAIEEAKDAQEYWERIKGQYESGYSEYKELLDTYNKAQVAYENAKKAYENKETEANKEKYSEAKQAYKEAKEALNNSTEKDSYDQYLSASLEFQNAENTEKQCEKAIEDRKRELEKQYVAFKDREYEAKKASEKATKELEEFQSDYSGSSSVVDLYVAYQDAKKAYDEAKEKASNVQITSPVSGVVLSTSKVAGETTESGEEVASIQLAGKGFTLSFAVTKDQARYISVGDEAEVTNSYWYTDVHAKITSIKTDPQDPQAGKKVTFQLEGDITNGQSLTLTAGKRTANYDFIVPNSAIREDNNGKFVLRIKSKSTPLGNRYIAERVDVTVIAEDDTHSAVNGVFEGYDYIITTSSKPIEEGQQVRLKES
ncbi:MAG: HlyD family efflux transporter periplasmic adaptor subunit [Lachnospiraceae bacterium]|nr:HlyD family efflux transporter periplasmic adaptor subunit [Lachnospiraceae bacterium]